jgi:integrase
LGNEDITMTTEIPSPVQTSGPAITPPRLTFEHRGLDRTLNKHPVVQLALRRGELTLADAKPKPWYLRAHIGDRERTYALPAGDKAAIRRAKDILDAPAAAPDAWAEFLRQRDARRGVSVGQLATDWITAGLPFSKTKTRETAAADRLQATLTRGLPFWSDKPAASITQAHLEDFVVWRRGHIRAGARFTGTRSADLQLAALSCLCQWAVRVGKITANPFDEREQFTTDVKHCHEAMPANDDQFHAVLNWFFTDQADLQRIVAGAWLATSALTGLRPGEPTLLRRVPESASYPADFISAAPGLIYPLPDGTRRMKVTRLKHGQNPAVLVRPVLDDFLSTWRAWLAEHYPLDGAAAPATPLPLFPGVGQDRVNHLLAEACAALKLPAMKPHGFGRAYYVRVRRSQGADDPTIAVELGQTTNGKLIRSTYGDPLDPVGGNLHDWLPAQGPAAWAQLRQASASNIIAL